MVIAFLIWWWYFDGAEAAAERGVHTRREARAFVVWSYAHLPLYLGIAVAGVGVEHIVKIAPDGHVHGAEAWILGGAVTLLMLALTTIGATSERAQHDDQRSRRLTIQYAVALTPLALAPLADAAPLVSIVSAMATLCLSQAMLAQVGREPSRSSADPAQSELQPFRYGTIRHDGAAVEQ